MKKSKGGLLQSLMGLDVFIMLFVLSLTWNIIQSGSHRQSQPTDPHNPSGAPPQHCVNLCGKTDKRWPTQTKEAAKDADSNSILLFDKDFKFTPGSADLTPTFQAELRDVQIDKLIKKIKHFKQKHIDVNRIEIIGHTDSQPVTISGAPETCDRMLKEKKALFSSQSSQPKDAQGSETTSSLPGQQMDAVHEALTAVSTVCKSKIDGTLADRRLFETSVIPQFPWGDNVGLGMMRAVAVVRFLKTDATVKQKLSEANLLNEIEIVPLSAGPLMQTNGKLVVGGLSEDDQQRRRIEIRVLRLEY